MLRDEGWPPEASRWCASCLECCQWAGLVLFLAGGEDHAILHRVWAALDHGSCSFPPASAHPFVILLECLPLDGIDLVAEEGLHVRLRWPVMVIAEADRAHWCVVLSSEVRHHIVRVEAEDLALLAEREYNVLAADADVWSSIWASMLRVNVAPVAKVSMAAPVDAHNVNHEAIQLRTPLQAVDLADAGSARCHQSSSVQVVDGKLSDGLMVRAKMAAGVGHLIEGFSHH